MEAAGAQGQGQEALAPGARAALAWLALAITLGMAAWFSAAAVLGQLRALWDLSPTAGAWLTIAVQLGFVAGALVSASLTLTDVLPPRALFAVSALLAAGANLAMVGARGPGTAIAYRFATGFFLAGVYPTAMKLISTWYRAGRGTAIGVLTGAIALGSALPHLVNGLGGVSWRPVIVATSVLTACGALAVRFVGEGPYPFPRAVFDPRQVGRVFANRGVRLASFGYFGHMWELFAMWAWFLPFLIDSQAARGATGGALPSIGTFAVIAAGAAGCVAGGVLGDRWGRSRTTSAAMAISGSCALGMGALFGRAPWAVLALGVVWGVTVIADSGQFSTAVTEVADPTYVGTALTVQLALGFTLTVVTIWLVPIVRDAASWWWAMAMLAFGPALGIAAMQRLQRAPESAAIAGGRG